LLGKNGEPKRNIKMDLKMNRIRHFNKHSPTFKEVTLTTNRDGKVKIGKITGKLMM
jgi:hypothetical protein